MTPGISNKRSSNSAKEFPCRFLISNPGHSLCLSLRETCLDIVSGSAANEEVMELVHIYQIIYDLTNIKS